MIKRNILLNPGPATTTDTVKQSLIVPDICPREKEFQKIMERVRKDLVKIACGDDDYTSILFASSGTGAMEATMSSVVPPKNSILILSNGTYGERFENIAKYYKYYYIVNREPWGKNINLEILEDELSAGIFSTVFVVHHETSTGILNPIEKIGRIVKKYNCTYVVDAISSFAGIPFNIKKIKADYIISTSNKCIQGMPGISFVICKKSELEKTQLFARSLYFDLFNQYKFLEENGQMRFTPPVQVIYALKHAITEFFEEGAENRYKRYKDSHKTLVDGMKKRGFKLFLGDDVEHSYILETFYEPENKNFNFNVFHDKLYKKGYTIYPSHLSNKKTFRIAVMGAIDKSDVQSFLESVDDISNDTK